MGYFLRIIPGICVQFWPQSAFSFSQILCIVEYRDGSWSCPYPEVPEVFQFRKYQNGNTFTFVIVDQSRFLKHLFCCEFGLKLVS